MVKHIKADRALVLSGIIVFIYYHGLVKGFFTVLWSWNIHGVLFNIFSQVARQALHMQLRCTSISTMQA